MSNNSRGNFTCGCCTNTPEDIKKFGDSVLVNAFSNVSNPAENVTSWSSTGSPHVHLRDFTSDCQATVPGSNVIPAGTTSIVSSSPTISSGAGSSFQNFNQPSTTSGSSSSFSFPAASSNTVSDFSWLDSIEVDEAGVNRQVKKFEYLLKNEFETNHELAWLLRAVTCIDLTTLSGDDTRSNVQRLCYKAAHPLSTNLIKLFKEEIDFKGIDKIRTAAVCVYPNRVSDASQEIKSFKLNKEIHLASVATGFPSGQYPLSTKLKEIKYCISQGATEIDIVISRELVICGKWKELYDEIKNMKNHCGTHIHLKTILATGELGSLKNVYKASLVAMMAGSDFIKTSTGKEAVNATLQVGIVMCRAIEAYYEKTGRKVGLKPAGGIRTSQDALSWLVLVKEMLGNDWLNSKLFRIGASGLLGDIEKRLFYLIKGYKPPSNCFFSV